MRAAAARVADTWLESHPSAELDCDGKQHVQWFTIDASEQGYGEATTGVGWVQFCLIDPTFEDVAIVQEWRSVR